MKIVSAKKKLNRAQTTKMLNDTRHQRRENMSKLREDFENETRKRRNKGNKIPLLANDYYNEMEKFSNNQIPGPGYYSKEVTKLKEQLKINENNNNNKNNEIKKLPELNYRKFQICSKEKIENCFGSSKIGRAHV